MKPIVASETDIRAATKLSNQIIALLNGSGEKMWIRCCAVMQAACCYAFNSGIDTADEFAELAKGQFDEVRNGIKAQQS